MSGMASVEESETFQNVLSTLLAIGNCLNSTQVTSVRNHSLTHSLSLTFTHSLKIISYCLFQSKGFNIEYLTKVPEVKDTQQKHSLLHHLCNTVLEIYPDSGDLHSEMGAVARCSKVLPPYR